MYKEMCEILQDKEIGIAKVEKYNVGEFGIFQGVAEGQYVRLIVDGELMMSNTSMEKRTAREFVYNAKGDVLIAGLGIGLVIMPLLDDDSVKSITVVEKHQDVIDCVLPQLKQHDKNNKLNVICEDAFEFTTKNKYDVVYLDIWPFINEDIYQEEMKPLKRKYRKFLSEHGKQYKDIYVWGEYQAKHGLRLY